MVAYIFYCLLFCFNYWTIMSSAIQSCLLSHCLHSITFDTFIFLITLSAILYSTQSLQYFPSLESIFCFFSSQIVDSWAVNWKQWRQFKESKKAPSVKANPVSSDQKLISLNWKCFYVVIVYHNFFRNGLISEILTRVAFVVISSTYCSM